MSTMQLVFVVVAASAAALALVGAFVAWRALTRAGAALHRTSQNLSATAANLPARAANARDRFADVNGQSERLSAMLGEVDGRIESSSAHLLATRAASDTLRLRLIEGRLTIARIRQLMRLLVRLGELRRDFL
jgi:HAMP domain-containing protein